VLVLAPTGRDAVLARAVMAEAGMVAVPCDHVPELCAEMSRGAGAVLLAEEGLDAVSLERLTFELDRQPAWSDLPLLVFPAQDVEGGRPLREALAAARNVTLLQRPVSVPSLVTAVKAALRARRRQYELRDVLARLEQDVSQRDRFLAMLGHELRNPLGAIRNALYAMDATRPTGTNERWERSLEIINRQAGLLTRLVDDLLDVSRVTTGKIVLRRVPVDLADLALRCVHAVEGTATRQGVAVRFEVDPGGMVVGGDAARLEQVVMNLIGNAIKYTPAGGRVDVELRRRGAQAFLYVRDTGVGLSAEVLPRVFELFVQAEHTLERAQGGMGIGLTLVRSLVELHGGTVAAASEGAGRGSTFTVRLPLLALSAAPPAPAPAPPDQSLHILVVEDSADNRESLVLLLQQLGHQVATAEDGQVGLARLEELRPQVALIDIGLPRLDGYELARQARERVGRQSYLVALTGYGQPDDQRRAYQAGFDAHLTKPLRLEGLNEVLTRASRAAGAAG
jgi:signal transduction histidine kinase/CheY-like chemotaxis protein